ncbi:aldehyde dehydrogenase family protein [Streptomyces xiaopingdaonensis]|uniref:aldehyde dehydrogenase family protein n=1 Tax=Streptomyces xiaopingdaonensis TaxID=1565415 RepID=UPI00031E4FD8|nr:aldehyde dehydrogenase family protein [Streptomyces xiaopingdaonensis]
MTTAVPAFRRGAWHASPDTAPLPGPGRPTLALVPPVVAHSDHAWWRGRRPSPAPPPAERRAVVRAALRLFRSGTVTVGTGTQSASAFRAALWAHAGLPEALTDRWSRMLCESASARSVAGADDALAFVALPGNTFTCLDAVVEQIERSGAVWLRPSRREPWSAARLVAALLEAGWPPDRIGLYPGERRLLAALVRRTDRQVVFGGQDLARSLSDRPGLTVHGAGRGCALVPEGVSAEAAADWLAPLVAADAGRFCSNVRTVLCEGEAEPLARVLAARLDALRTSREERRFPLAAFRVPGAAERAAGTVTDRIRPGDRLLTERPTTEPAVDGGGYALPRLVLADTAGTPERFHPLIGHEVPYPSVTVLRVTDAALRSAVGAQSLFVHRYPESAATSAPGPPPQGDR